MERRMVYLATRVRRDLPSDPVGPLILFKVLIRKLQTASTTSTVPRSLLRAIKSRLCNRSAKRYAQVNGGAWRGRARSPDKFGLLTRAHLVFFRIPQKTVL